MGSSSLRNGRQTGRGIPGWGIAVLIPLGFFLYAPIGVILVNSFNADATLTSWGGATLHWYSLVVHDPDVRNALKNSLLLAGASTSLSLVVGVSGALWLQHRRGPVATAVTGLTYARLFLPELVLAVALFLFFSATSLGLGFTAMMLGHTVVNSAYVSLVVQARLQNRPDTTDEAARDLGATRWRTFRRVTLPDIMPGVVTAALMAFTFSFDNIVTSFFLSGDNVVTIPILVFSKIRFVLTPEVNAIAAVMMVVTTAGLAGLLTVGRRARLLGGRI